MILHVTATIMEQAEALAAAASEYRQVPGEPRDDANWGYYLSLTEAHVMHCVAGRIAEELGGFEPYPIGWSGDEAVARVMADGVCVCVCVCGTPAAVEHYLAKCRAEVTAILEQHFDELAACARALRSFGTLDAAQIDTIIDTIAGRKEREGEQQRRKRENVRAAHAAAVQGMFELLPPR